MYFTCPSNSTATAASSYQPSTRPMKPAASWISTCNSGRGRPEARRARRPRVSSGDSARPSESPSARAACAMPIRWAPASTARTSSPRVAFRFCSAASMATTPSVRDHSLAQSTSVRGTDVAAKPSQGSTSLGGQRRLGHAVSASAAPLVVSREPDLRGLAPREDKPVQAGGGGVAQYGPGTEAQQHGDAIDEVPLALVRRHQMVRADVDALPESRPPQAAQFGADVLHPVAEPQRLLTGEHAEATGGDRDQLRVHAGSLAVARRPCGAPRGQLWTTAVLPRRSGSSPAADAEGGPVSISEPDQQRARAVSRRVRRGGP